MVRLMVGSVSCLTGVDVNAFVEASEALVEPLEDFFNNVFVMAVSTCSALRI